ncbi:MAG: hypothetical protein ACI4JJ_03180 [Huintestinicola sp.]
MIKCIYYPNFKNYYLNTAKYADKVRLYNDFPMVYYRLNNLGINDTRLDWLKENFNADMKKKLKVQLIAKNHTPGGIDGFFRAFTNYMDSL